MKSVIPHADPRSRFATFWILCLATMNPLLSFGLLGAEPAPLPSDSQLITRGGADIMPMPSVAPLFLEGAGFTSVLHLVNETTVPIEAEISAFSLDGVERAQRRITVAAFGLAVMPVSELVRLSLVPLTIGSLRISSSPAGDGLLSALAFSYSGQINTYFDEELPMPTTEGSKVLRGVADVGNESVVAITSLSTRLQHVSLTCSLERGRQKRRVLELRSGETLVEKPCLSEGHAPILSGSDIIDETLKSEDKETDLKDAAAISLVADGMPGELAAFGVVPHRTGGELFFTIIDFADPKFKRSSGAVYVGVPVGSSPLLTDGAYRPEVTLANFGATMVSVHIKSAVTSDKPETKHLASLSLAGGEVKTIRLDTMPPAADLRSSVLIETNARAGDLVTKLSSRGPARLPAIELLDKEIANGTNGGGHPWSMINGITSMLLLFNHDAKSQSCHVRFERTATGREWSKTYVLRSMDTLAINIRDLIATEELDDHGYPLLMTAPIGEIGWRSDSAEIAGRVLQTNPDIGLARNFSCSNYYTICNPAIAPSTLELFLDQTLTLSGSETWNLNHLYPSQSCSCSNPTSGAGTLYYDWTSANGNIASISSGATSSSSQWFGQSGGSTTSTYTVTGPYNLSCSNQTPARVHIPYRVDAINTVSQGQSYCVASPHNGYLRTVTYQIFDQFGAPYPKAVNMQDQILIETPNDLGASSTNVSSPFQSQPNGQWPDNLSVCSAACYASTGSTAATQLWYANGVQLPGPTSLTYKCNAIYVNGH